MPERPALLIVAEQRELLRQALADAVFYRDPPVDCDACDPVDGLCDECAAGLARATAYLELGEKLGMEVPGMTGAERAAAALMATCGFCWASPGVACDEEGLHLARYVRSYRRGLVSRKDLALICEALPNVSAGHIVAEVPAVPR